MGEHCGYGELKDLSLFVVSVKGRRGAAGITGEACALSGMV